MKNSRVAQFLLLAVLVFGLGAGFAYWRGKNPLNLASQTSATPESTETAANTAPSTEEGKVTPDAPAMPETAATAPAITDAAPAAGTEKAAEAPVAGTQVGGPFTLTDHKGNAVTEASWPSKYKLVFFGFTKCPDVCPATLQKISAAVEKLDPNGEKVQPLFISTDAANDTQETMAIYMGGYPKVLGLTGTKEQLDAAAAAYKVYVSGPDHSSYVYLMSPEGKTVDILPSNLSAEEMEARLKEKMTSAAAPAATETAPASSAAPATTGEQQPAAPSATEAQPSTAPSTTAPAAATEAPKAPEATETQPAAPATTTTAPSSEAAPTPATPAEEAPKSEEKSAY